ncbi:MULTISPECIES: YtzI protein [Cytobacillus]|uniref:YtzI protein n=1 Tax=Cytobacillus stercorigallinarum TaxID=2762240 RepID=A0ABR8QIT4_9BACI|nr:YtzI protein [Cytobacillus stercorigallinarum]MBD7935434.1 YtzI protein [Cytobacillus stercorigallinarum]
MTYIIVIMISILIVFTILILSVMTTSKAYTFKHTVDPLPKSLTEEEKAPNQEDKETK